MTDDIDKFMSEIEDPYSVVIVKSNVVKFPDNNKPDKDHIFVDSENVIWYEFTCSYSDEESKNYIFSIWAKSKEDAEQRMASLRNTAKVDGQLFKEIEC